MRALKTNKLDRYAAAEGEVMGMEELDVLRVENDHLRLLVQQDSLTGLLNRGAVEARVAALLREHTPGVLLMIDVDNFKSVNDKFGHLMGDKALRELARLLGYYFGRGSVIGRLGGDEFAVFLVGRQTRRLVRERMERLNARIAQAGAALGIGDGFHVTAGAEFAQNNDSFPRLYERADGALRAEKQSRTMAVKFYDTSVKGQIPNPAAPQTIQPPSIDIKYISRQLREKAPAAGACFYDFSTFLSVYRFLERGLKRTGQSVQLILVSLMNQYGDFIALEERDRLVEQLRESIYTTLRTSDIYTQYSACQFLIMAQGAAQEHTARITDRVQDAFHMLSPNKTDIRLSFCFYPLQPALQKSGAPEEDQGRNRRSAAL